MKTCMIFTPQQAILLTRSSIKPKKMRSVTPDTHGEEKHLEFWLGNLRKRGHLEDRGVHCKIMSLRNRIEGHGLDSCSLGKEE